MGTESTATLTLTEFLLARIAKDEAAIEDYALPGHFWSCGGEWAEMTIGRDRALAECEAKRRIVKRCEGWLRDYALYGDDSGAARLGDEVLHDLASVYADHPEYREEWRADT